MAVKSAERVLDIFEHLSTRPDGLTAKELSEQLGWAGSSTFELLKTLSEREYLSMDAGRRYTLGPRLINLGMSAAAMLDINKIAAPTLRKTMELLGETVFLAVLSGDEVVYVAKANSSKTITTTIETNYVIVWLCEVCAILWINPRVTVSYCEVAIQVVLS